jgi:hypothetical protein
MTATEDRLSDALHTAARSVTAPTLRPLDGSPVPRLAPAQPRLSRRRWVAAIASAAAVALIAGLVVTVSGRLRSGPEASAAGLPRYYAEGDFPSRSLTIRATATGQVTAVVPDPGRSGLLEAVATPDDRTFFADYDVPGSLVRIYRFQVTTAGQVSGLTPVPGGNLGGDAVVMAMAASPDGSRLAIALGSDVVSPAGYSPDKIVVLDTRTGARTTWAGGRAPRGMDPRTVVISQLSWTADGHELVYLAGWTCPHASRGTAEICAFSGPLGADQEVRTLNPAGRGGSLLSGRRLLTSSGGDLAAAVISPDGSVVSAVRVLALARRHGQSRRRFIVTQFDARTGQQLRPGYSATTHGGRPTVHAFVPGPSGRYLLVIGGARDGVNGWIGDGRLHGLAPAAADVSSETW